MYEGCACLGARLGWQITSGTMIEIPPGVDRELLDIAREMLTVDPARRPSIDQLLEKPIIQEHVKRLAERALDTSSMVLHDPGGLDSPVCRPALSTGERLACDAAVCVASTLSWPAKRRGFVCGVALFLLHVWTSLALGLRVRLH